MSGRSILFGIVLVLLVCIGVVACADDSERGSVREEVVDATVEPISQPTAAEKRIQEILRGTIEVMQEVESFHFEERYEAYELWSEGHVRSRDEPFFLSTGDFQRPGKTRKIAFFDYRDHVLGIENAFGEHAEGVRYEVVNIDSRTYISQGTTGRWKPYRVSVPVDEGTQGRHLDYDHVLHGPDGDYLYMLRRNPIDFVKRLPSLMWAQERSVKSRQMSVKQIVVDEVEMHYIESTKVTDDQIERVTTRIKIWVGVQDKLVRELTREVNTRQGHCDASKQVCPGIQIDPTFEIDRFVFSRYGQDVEVELPTFEDPATESSPVGDMTVYEGASATFSILYPGERYPKDTYTTRWRTADGRDVFYRKQGYFESKDHNNGYLAIRILNYDKLAIEQSHQYQWCNERVERDFWQAECEALEKFLEVTVGREATIEHYVDYWEAWGWAPPGWGHLPQTISFKVLSQQRIEKADGFTGEILEINQGYWGPPFRLALYLYRPDEPMQGCHPESNTCNVLVIVAYAGNRGYLAELSDEIDYSFNSFQVHAAAEASPVP